jgi:acyl-CoA oxidase
MVRNFTQTPAGRDVDASVNQRLAKAVTEAFVAAQVGEMISNLANLPSEDAKVVGSLYRLVSCYLRYWKRFDCITSIVLTNMC